MLIIGSAEPRSVRCRTYYDFREYDLRQAGVHREWHEFRNHFGTEELTRDDARNTWVDRGPRTQRLRDALSSGKFAV